MENLLKDKLYIVNAYKNNLKNISLTIPYDKLNVLIGPSGSGKSSLAFETIYAKSQQELFRILGDTRPNIKEVSVEQIINLHVCINLSQDYYSRNPRSFVGTYTGISNTLRSFFNDYINNKFKLKLKAINFSRNDSNGWCPICKGIGLVNIIDEDTLTSDNTKNLEDGAITFFKDRDGTNYKAQMLKALCLNQQIAMNIAYKELPKSAKDIIFYGLDTPLKLDFSYKNAKKSTKKGKEEFIGIIPFLNSQIAQIDKPSIEKSIAKFLKETTCPECNGIGLSKKYGLNSQFAIDLADYGQCSYADLESMPVFKLKDYLKAFLVSHKEVKVYEVIILYIIKNLESFDKLKISYLSLNRSIPSLSSGEFQRLRLSTEISSSLSGLLYIFDEPCQGLHIKDIELIKNVCKELIAKNNTILAIEHNPLFIKDADNIIKFGLGSGINGGAIIPLTEQELANHKNYNHNLSFKKNVRPYNADQTIKLKNVSINNLKNINLAIPFDQFVLVTGVSGSGKSSLVKQALVPSLLKGKAINMQAILYNKEKLRKTYFIDHQPISKNKRSTVGSYLEVMPLIYALLEKEAQKTDKTIKANFFSRNVDHKYRCPECSGTGIYTFEFADSDAMVSHCSNCDGVGFVEYILQFKYQNLSIVEIENLSIAEAISVFNTEKAITTILTAVQKLGIDYLKLNQKSSQISGGEAQRLRLATILKERKQNNNIYILDEPTIGLSGVEIEILSKILNDLIDSGNGVIAIDHNIDFITTNADYVIDTGLTVGVKELLIADSIVNIINNKNVSWIDSIEVMPNNSDLPHKCDNKYDYSNPEGRKSYLSTIAPKYKEMYMDLYSRLNKFYTNIKFNIISIGAGSGIDYLAAKDIFGKGNFTWKGVDNQDWGDELQIDRALMIFEDFFKIDLNNFASDDKGAINFLFFPYSFGDIAFQNFKEKYIFQKLKSFCNSNPNTLIVIIDSTIHFRKWPDSIIGLSDKYDLKPLTNNTICRIEYDRIDQTDLMNGIHSEPISICGTKCAYDFCSCLPKSCKHFISVLKYEPKL